MGWAPSGALSFWADRFGVPQGEAGVINSTLTYSVSPTFTVRFIVDNVFNKLPPFPALAGAQGNFTPAVSQYFEGVIGRSLLLGAEWRAF
jgi:outer membrane receptor protein involved in Fe transport